MLAAQGYVIPSQIQAAAANQVGYNPMSLPGAWGFIPQQPMQQTIAALPGNTHWDSAQQKQIQDAPRGTKTEVPPNNTNRNGNKPRGYRGKNFDPNYQNRNNNGNNRQNSNQNQNQYQNNNPNQQNPNNGNRGNRNQNSSGNNGNNGYQNRQNSNNNGNGNQRQGYQGKNFNPNYHNQSQQNGNGQNNQNNRTPIQNGQGSYNNRGNPRSQNRNAAASSDKPVRDPSLPIVCYGCSQVGHFWNECPALRDAQDPSKDYRKICLNCKEFGHYAGERPPRLCTLDFFNCYSTTPGKKSQKILRSGHSNSGPLGHGIF
jgi:hypothetical protein